MPNLPNCPKCNSEYTYEDGNLFVCPECAHEWSLGAETTDVEERKGLQRFKWKCVKRWRYGNGH